MATIANGNTVVEAWKSATSAVLNGPSCRVGNLLVEVADPVLYEPGWLKTYDPKSVRAKDRLSVVAKVIFPNLRRAALEPRERYYERSAALLRRARRSGRLHTSWGSTYFERLISLGGSENQIERAIGVLSGWKQRKEAAIVAHLSAPHLDGLKPIGSPCLQYLEILWKEDDSIDLVDVYLNHDYLNKALGNFIGLARLLHFISTESGKAPGQLVCHSVHA